MGCRVGDQTRRRRRSGRRCRRRLRRSGRRRLVRGAPRRGGQKAEGGASAGRRVFGGHRGAVRKPPNVAAVRKPSTSGQEVHVCTYAATRTVKRHTSQWPHLGSAKGKHKKERNIRHQRHLAETFCSTPWQPGDWFNFLTDISVNFGKLKENCCVCRSVTLVRVTRVADDVK